MSRPTTAIRLRRAVRPRHGDLDRDRDRCTRAKGSITATLLPDGKVLVWVGPTFGPPTPPELYDPATGTWTVHRGLGQTGRVDYGSATLLSDGTVLVTGGSDSGCRAVRPGHRVLDHHRVHAPRSTTGSAATLLLDGTVLVAGGSDCSTSDRRCPYADELSRAVRPCRRVAAIRGASLPEPAPRHDSRARPRARPRSRPRPVPIPPDARTWKVTVSNRSSEPATLFVAEEDEHGLLGGSSGPRPRTSCHPAPP